jgi:hypothetical protein
LILVLRRELKWLQAWPEAGDLFLELIPVSRWQSPTVTDEDIQWLPRIVEDALRGVDIGARYPAFFQKLTMSDDLCRMLLKALARRAAREP